MNKIIETEEATTRSAWTLNNIHRQNDKRNKTYAGLIKQMNVDKNVIEKHPHITDNVY